MQQAPSLGHRSAKTAEKSACSNGAQQCCLTLGKPMKTWSARHPERPKWLEPQLPTGTHSSLLQTLVSACKSECKLDATDLCQELNMEMHSSAALKEDSDFAGRSLKSTSNQTSASSRAVFLLLSPYI